MNSIAKAMLQLSLSFLIVFIFIVPGQSAEIDDSAVFVEAFNAYQQKDFLLTIEKCELLNQVFPDSPLRDVTLLLIARASLKSGENERAAKSIALFSTEFPESSLKSSVEEDLTVLASRHQKGEILAAEKTLQMAARKVRSDSLARERTAELKRESERAARVKAEQERITRIKVEEERLEKERLLAVKLAKASIKASVTLQEEVWQVPAGGTGRLAVEITNKGKNSEDFLLTLSAPKEYNAALASADKPDKSIQRIQLAAGESFKGVVVLNMPAGMVDGHRSGVAIKVASAKFGDVTFQKDATLICSAPLVRAVAKFTSQKIITGEKLRYRVTILNAGSLAAKGLTVRLQLPPEISFLGAHDASVKQEQNGTLVFKIDEIDIGKLVEINMDVKIRETSAVGLELRGNVEVTNESLKRSETFPARATVIAQSK